MHRAGAARSYVRPALLLKAQPERTVAQSENFLWRRAFV